MARPLRVLFVEDVADDAALALLELRRGGFEPTSCVVASGAELRAALSDPSWEIVICDHSMPNFDALSALAIVREVRGDLPFIAVSGTVGEDVAVEVMKAGANDYMLKDRLVRLVPAVERELREAESRKRRLQAEMSLRDSEAVKSTILDSAVDAIVTVNERGLVVEWNRAAIDTFGFEREQALGAPLADLIVPPAMRERHLGGFRRFVATGQSTLLGKRQDLVACAANGEEIPVEVAITARHVGNSLVVTGYLKDTRESRRAEERLRQTQKMEALGQLTGGVAHDFNNLLAIVQLCGESLRGTAADQETVASILRAAERGRDLTSRLLAFSRRQSLRPSSIDLIGFTASMTNLLRRILGENIEIKSRLAPGLWEAKADAGQLENAVLNLALNARDAMPRGGRLTFEAANLHRREHTRDEPMGDYVVLSLRDNGIGMTPAVMARAFEPFFTTKDLGKGSGLGLAMVYGFVQQSGGFVTLDSREGKGTLVSLHLPRSSEDSTQQTADSRLQTPRGRCEFVLVVEDNDELRRIVSDMVESLGYGVLNVPTAEVGLEEITRREIDLLLTDAALPGEMGGFDLIEAARKLRPHLAAIVMSGYDWDQRESGLPHEDRIRKLAKPFAKAELARALRDALD